MINADTGAEHREVLARGDNGVCLYRIPALVATKQQTLIAVCEARINRMEDPPNKINLVMRRSPDNGRTWTPLRHIAQFGAEEAAADPCMLVDRDTGRIWIAYDYAVPRPGLLHDRDMRFHLIYSDDDGETWSGPRDLTPALRKPGWLTIQSAPGIGIQTRAGTLVFPAYTHQDAPGRCHLIYSRDHGETWEISSGAGRNSSESQIVELADGSVLINMRQAREKGCRSVAVTGDLGKTWSDPVDDKNLIDPGCQACVLRLTFPDAAGGRSRILFSNAAHPASRLNLTLRLSYDEGRTWPIAKLLHAERSMYSSLASLPDRAIGLLYERNLNIAFARITLDWLTDGQDR